MSKCVNKSDSNYKRLKTLVNNELAIALVWEYLDGNVDSIKTKEDFMSIAKKARDQKSKGEVAQLKGGTSVPLSKFSFEQKNELVDNIIFLASWDSENQTVKDVEDISFSDIKEKLTYQKKINPDYTSNYDEVLKEDNLNELIAKAKSKLASLGVIVDSEEDPDNKSEGAQYQESYLVANIDKARVNAKLLVAFLPEEELGTTLGLRKFNNFTKTWNDLENLLSSTIANKGEIDKLPYFLELISKEAIYKPQFRFLKKILDNSTEQKKTQFFRALNNYKVNYTTTTIAPSELGYDTKIIDSDTMSNTNKVLSIWDSNFQEAFIQEKNGVPIANNFTASKILKNYNLLLDNIIKSKSLNQNDKNNTLVLLKSIGIELHPKALDIYLNNTDKNPLEALKNLFRNDLSFLFIGTRFSTNSIDKLAEGKLETTGEEILTPLKNESRTLKKLAEIQQRFEKNLSSNSVLGPEGKMFQTITQYDYISKKIVELNNDDAYLYHLDSPYTTNSYFIPYLKNNDDARKNLKLLYFNSRKLQGKDAGLGINDVSEVDELVDRVERVLNGQVPYLTLADKNRLYYVEGLPLEDIKTPYVSDTIVRRFVGYFADELVSMRKAWEDIYGENPIPKEQQLLNYHYKIDKNGDRIPGNAFTSALFPELSPDSELSKDLGLYSKIDNNKPFIISPTYISEDNGEISVQPGFNEIVFPIVKKALEDKIDSTTKEFLDKLVTRKDDKVVDTSFSTKTWNNIIGKYSDVERGVRVVAANYTINTLMSNIEFSKMFTGDPRKYKSLEDYSKRVPATSATGDYLRIGPGVKPNFYVAIAPNFNESSDYLFNDAHRENIKEFIGATSKEDKTAIDTILDSYRNVNRTDAQGWITMDRFKEILVGLGEWNEDKMNTPFNRIKLGKALPEDYTIFSQKMTTFQPKKGVHFELIKHKGEIVPVYLKYSQAILFPELVSTSPKLTKIAKAMEDQGVDELVVGDGIKAGAIGISDIEAAEIKFNKIRLSNSEWKLQQDLPFKDKETLVGSQIKKNIVADISLDADYDGIKGSDLVKAIHKTDGELSNRGYKKVLKKLGITSKGVDLNVLYDSLIEEFESDDESKNLIDALKQRIPLDFILSHRQTIFNKINSIFNKATVKLKQPGGAAIQLSNYGFDAGKRFQTYDKTSSAVKNGIVWLQADNELKPPRVEVDPSTGKKVFKPGQVLLPYNRLARLFGKEWDNIKTLSPSAIAAKIDKDVLRLIGYRIPNQKLASNDSLEIVGILPPHAGNTIISFSEITAKTGSDFDIDKMYYIQPNISFNKKTGKVEAVKYLDELTSEEERYEAYIQESKKQKEAKELLKNVEKDNWSNVINENLSLKESLLNLLEMPTDSTEDIIRALVENDLAPSFEEFKTWSIEEQNTTKALESRRIDLYRKVLESSHSFSRLISTVDADWLSDYINSMLPKQDLTSLQLFSGDFQMNQRREFIASKGGVGQVANQLTDHAISQWAGKYIVEPENRIDIGHLTPEGHLDLSQLNNTAGKNITETISAYMNAFVDAAKDNYIGRANFNFQTNNVAFLLIRNGVDPLYVTAFLSQPAIKRYVELVNSKEGQAVPLSTSKPYDIVLEELQPGIFEDLTNDYKLSNFTEKELFDMASGKAFDARKQAELLNLFKHIQDVSKHLRNSVLASKADTSGAGTNLLEAIIINNMKQNVSNSGSIGNWNEMFNKEGIDTMLGTYHKNSVEAVINNVSPLSILGTEGMLFTVNQMYHNLYGKYPDNYQKANKLFQLAYAARISKLDSFNISKESLESLMKGDKSIAKRVIALKNSSEFKDNSLVAMLVPKIGRNQNLHYISLNNAKGRNKKVNEEISEAWLELYNSPKTNKFAKDLAIYSFYTSALTDNLSSLYRLMPWQLNQDLGLSTEGFNRLKTDLNTQDKGILLEELQDLVLRNSWYDTALVPRISNKQAVNVIGEQNKSKVFGVNTISSPALHVGNDMKGSPIFKPYVTRSLSTLTPSGISIESIALYKYIGNHLKETENGFIETGVYKRVGKLGESKGIYKMFEFDAKTSIVPNNNYVLEESLDTLAENLVTSPTGFEGLEENISSDLQSSEKDANFVESVQIPSVMSSLTINEENKTITLKNGETYSFEEVTADILTDADYTPEEAGEILTKLCK